MRIIKLRDLTKWKTVGKSPYMSSRSLHMHIVFRLARPHGNYVTWAQCADLVLGWILHYSLVNQFSHILGGTIRPSTASYKIRS